MVFFFSVLNDLFLFIWEEGGKERETGIVRLLVTYSPNGHNNQAGARPEVAASSSVSVSHMCARASWGLAPAAVPGTRVGSWVRDNTAWSGAGPPDKGCSCLKK